MGLRWLADAVCRWAQSRGKGVHCDPGFTCTCSLEPQLTGPLLNCSIASYCRDCTQRHARFVNPRRKVALALGLRRQALSRHHDGLHI